jgi:hypothetical protein
MATLGGVWATPGGVWATPGGVWATPGRFLATQGGVKVTPGGVWETPGGIGTTPGGVWAFHGGIWTTPAGVLNYFDLLPNLRHFRSIYATFTPSYANSPVVTKVASKNILFGVPVKKFNCPSSNSLEMAIRLKKEVKKCLIL